MWVVRKGLDVAAAIAQARADGSADDVGSDHVRALILEPGRNIRGDESLNVASENDGVAARTCGDEIDNALMGCRVALPTVSGDQPPRTLSRPSRLNFAFCSSLSVA
jgi:hypothetical protein